MARSKNFFGLRRGSTKTHTYSVLRGEQVTKDRVWDVTNPQTTAQMITRLTFATAGVFYKHAVRNLFEFAFEDKKATESQYNAFMRHNAMRGVMSTKYMIDADMPALGNWILSNGRLGTIQVENGGESETFYVKSIKADEGGNTIAKVSAAILASSMEYQEGDIVTVVRIAGNRYEAAANFAQARDEMTLINSEEPTGLKWDIQQFRLDTSDETVLEYLALEMYDGDHTLTIKNVGWNNGVAAAALIISRVEKGNIVAVTKSTLGFDTRTEKAITIGQSLQWKVFASDNYKINGGETYRDAILKGSLSQGKKKNRKVKFLWLRGTSTDSSVHALKQIESTLPGENISVGNEGVHKVYVLVGYEGTIDESKFSAYNGNAVNFKFNATTGVLSYDQRVDDDGGAYKVLYNGEELFGVYM